MGAPAKGEEDGLEESIPPFIPTLTFVVVWHCGYHRPTMLCNRLLLRGGIMDSSRLAHSTLILQQRWKERILFRTTNERGCPRRLRLALFELSVCEHWYDSLSASFTVYTDVGVFELVFSLHSQPWGFNFTPGAKKSTWGHGRQIQLRSQSRSR